MMTMTTTALPTTVEGLRKVLIDHDFLRPLPAKGLTGFSGTFERIVAGVETAMTERMEPLGGDLCAFPPLLPEPAFIATGYLGSFPQLIGSVNVFLGDEAEHRRMAKAQRQGEEWTDHLRPGRLDLLSAGCHSLYPTHAGQTLQEARRYELTGRCFRHEPSDDPFRLMSFRMREKVCLGTPADAAAHRDLCAETGAAFLRSLGLEITVDVANDPFFGRAAQILVEGQRSNELKYEFVCHVYADHPGTAIGSVNNHLDHFGLDFDIRTADGEPMHSACCGLGLERVTVALIATHGPDLGAWPDDARTILGLTP